MGSIKNNEVVRDFTALCKKTLRLLDENFSKIYNELSEYTPADITKYVVGALEKDLITISNHVTLLFDNVLRNAKRINTDAHEVSNLWQRMATIAVDAENGLIEWKVLMQKRSLDYIVDRPQTIVNMLSVKFQSNKKYAPYYYVLTLEKLLLELERTF